MRTTIISLPCYDCGVQEEIYNVLLKRTNENTTTINIEGIRHIGDENCQNCGHWNFEYHQEIIEEITKRYNHTQSFVKNTERKAETLLWGITSDYINNPEENRIHPDGESERIYIGKTHKRFKKSGIEGMECTNIKCKKLFQIHNKKDIICPICGTEQEVDKSTLISI